MLRILFDTNIFGNLLEEPDAGEIEDKIAEEKEFIVYDYHPIRREIRDIPTTTILSKRTRGLLLSMYDRITGNHHLKDSDEILILAQEYFEQYRMRGGIHGWHTSIKVDFQIVACASNNLKINFNTSVQPMDSSPHSILFKIFLSQN